MIKTIFAALTGLIIFSSCASNKTSKSPEYTVVPDTLTKVLRGIVNRKILESDTSFSWYKESIRYGEADISAVAALKKMGRNVVLWYCLEHGATTHKTLFQNFFA